MTSEAALATVYYDYELAAQTGTSSLVSIENEISINELGQVAFIGDQNAASGFESVYVGGPGALAVSINPGFSAAGRVFGPGVEINNASPAQVGARDSLSGNTFFRSWNVMTGAGTIIDRTDTGPFFDTGFRPGLNDSGARTHGSTLDPAGAQEVLVLPGGGTVNVTNLAAGLRSAIANDGSVVARVGMNANETDPIIYYDAAGTPTTIASMGMGWTALGRAPGISQDGSIVVWSGNRGDGLGIFAAPVSAPTNITRIVGENGNVPIACPAPSCTTDPDLGYDATGTDILLTFTAAQRDSKIGVAHQETAGPGLTAGNSFVVTFLGTPSEGSIDNPKLPPGTPLFFSNQAGVWAVRVDLENELEPPMGLVFNPNSATPVAQVGETLFTPSGSFAISTITELYDPIANVALDAMGTPRTQRRGDHQIAFRATSGASTIVIRAVQRDSDEDGLYDHWEEVGGGIDVNRDGTIDLDLNALGADPLMRDIFLEIDWTRPRTDPPRSYSNQPADGALKMVAAVFAAAPALPNGIPMGINAHIDAGAGKDTLGDDFSVNFTTGHQGGDLVGQAGMPTAHLDLVYMGADGSFSVSGAQTRAFGDIKQNFFGSADLFAREFAFHYVMLADSHSAYEDFATDSDANGQTNPGDGLGADGVLSLFEAPYSEAQGRGATPTQPMVSGATANTVSVSGIMFTTIATGLAGEGVLVTSGAGAGQLRKITANTSNSLTVTPNWSTPPGVGDTIVLVPDSSGLAEGDYRQPPNNHGIPGNDFMMTLSTFDVISPGGFLAGEFVQWRTLVHELGHNLGLRHCGVTTDASVCIGSPASYLSLMSYAHQNVRGTGVNSYSSGPPFNDWFNLRPDFNRAMVHMGNTQLLGLGAGLGSPLTDRDINTEPGQRAYEQANGPLDALAPALNITVPTYGSNFLQSENLPVVFTATDNVALAPGMVRVMFDVDGSGAIDQTGESQFATPTGNPNEFTVTFASLAGPDGIRSIDARATDTSSNVGQDKVPIVIPEPEVTLMLLCAVPALGLLARLRKRRARP